MMIIPSKLYSIMGINDDLANRILYGEIMNHRSPKTRSFEDINNMNKSFIFLTGIFFDPFNESVFKSFKDGTGGEPSKIYFIKWVFYKIYQQYKDSHGGKYFPFNPDIIKTIIYEVGVKLKIIQRLEDADFLSIKSEMITDNGIEDAKYLVSQYYDKISEECSYIFNYYTDVFISNFYTGDDYFESFDTILNKVSKKLNPLTVINRFNNNIKAKYYLCLEIFRTLLPKLTEVCCGIVGLKDDCRKRFVIKDEFNDRYTLLIYPRTNLLNDEYYINYGGVAPIEIMCSNEEKYILYHIHINIYRMVLNATKYLKLSPIEPRMFCMISHTLLHELYHIWQMEEIYNGKNFDEIINNTLHPEDVEKDADWHTDCLYKTHYDEIYNICRPICELYQNLLSNNLIRLDDYLN